MGDKILVAKHSFDDGDDRTCKKGEPYIGPEPARLLKEGKLYCPEEEMLEAQKELNASHQLKLKEAKALAVKKEAEAKEKMNILADEKARLEKLKKQK